jgi:uncharacterized low-complexity protein
MKMASKKKVIGVAVGSAFAAGMAMTPMANAAGNPFALQNLQGGYMVAADTTATTKAPEAKCGQGKCGGMKSAEAKCGAAKTGEAKCGMGMMDANKDGKVSKGEFMKAHEAMFAAKDANKDGVLDANEMKPAMEGKCGQGKCGAMPKK